MVLATARGLLARGRPMALSQRKPPMIHSFISNCEIGRWEVGSAEGWVQICKRRDLILFFTFKTFLFVFSQIFSNLFHFVSFFVLTFDFSKLVASAF